MDKPVSYIQNEIKVLSGGEHILQRPSMYIGKPSLYGFLCFVVGISIGEQFANHGAMVAGRDKCKVFGIDWFEFGKWVMQTHATPEHLKTLRKPDDLALALSNNDDKEAFYLYIKWVQQYKELHK